MMSGTHGDRKISTQKYNDAFEMVPTHGKLFSGLQNTFSQVSGSVHKAGDEQNASNQGQDNKSFEEAWRDWWNHISIKE